MNDGAPRPAREERPCEGCGEDITGCMTPCIPIPTGLGAVIRTVIHGQEVIAVLADNADEEKWFESGLSWWYSDDEVRHVTAVLYPGIEVPS